MTESIYEYTEDEDPDDLANRMADSIRENFEVFPHERPHMGDDNRGTMVVEIPTKSYKWLTPKQKIRLIERGRLPEVWVEEIKERFGPPSPGYILQGYGHVDIRIRQQRLSDTDGGLTPTGRIRVQLYVASDMTSDIERKD